MLPKEKRLRAEKDFKRVYMRGSFFAMRYFGVNFAPNKLGFSRVAIVVNKKLSKKATVRNEIKRRFREGVRLLYPALPSGYDVIVNLKKEGQAAKLDDIQTEIKRAFTRVGEK